MLILQFILAFKRTTVINNNVNNDDQVAQALQFKFLPNNLNV